MLSGRVFQLGDNTPPVRRLRTHPSILLSPSMSFVPPHTHPPASARPLPSSLYNELFVKAPLKHHFFHEVFLDPSLLNICPSLSCFVHSTGFEGRGLLFIASDEELTVSQNISGSAQSWRQFLKANKSSITTGSSFPDTQKARLLEVDYVPGSQNYAC